MEGGDWRCGDMLREIQDLYKTLVGVSLSLVRRQGNKAADKRAVDAAKGMGLHDWLDATTSPLSIILVRDLTLARSSEDSFSGTGNRKGIG